MENILSSNTTKLDNTNSNSNDNKSNNYISKEDTTNDVNSTVLTSQDNHSVNENNENFTQDSQVFNNAHSIPIIGVKSDKFSKILFFVWLFGFVFSAVTYMIIYICFIKDLKKCSKLKYQRMEKILKNCKSQLNINKNIQIIVYDKISSPSIVGMFKVKIILPRNLINLSEELHSTDKQNNE